MRNNIKRKMLMGIGGLMVPVPQLITSKGLEKGVAGARAKANLLSVEERKIQHFIVREMARAKTPLIPEMVSKELDMPLGQVRTTIDKLEKMKTFLYRSDGKGINWAYPLSQEDTGHKITVNTGERFFAA